MKTKRTYKDRLVNSLHFWSLLLCFTLLSGQAFAQIVEPFHLRYSTQQKGNITFVTNGILQCNGTGGGASNCSNLATQTPPTTASWSQNNDHGASYIDIDGDASTFSSSADSLTLPDCSELLWAGIYWGARRNSSNAEYGGRDTIRIKIDNGAYVTVAADTLVDNTTGYTSYHCFADITSIMNQAPLQSKIFVADLYAQTGGTNRWGGWNIVVVYKNDLLDMRNLSVFDGIANISSSNNVDVDVEGFLTPLAGPVNFEIGVFAYDGDRGFTGDQLLFDGGSGFQNISNAYNPSNDIFNFSITNPDGVDQSQDPLIENNISIDSDIFAPDNSGLSFIGNSDTAATVRVTTGGETILLQTISLAIDVYEPDLRSAVRVLDNNGGLAEPGDTLTYTIVASNIGSDTSEKSFVVDTLEGNIQIVDGSVEYVFGPGTGSKTLAYGDDQVEYDTINNVLIARIGNGANAVLGGKIANSNLGTDSTVIQFQAVVSSNCQLIACNNEINNRAFIYGTGGISGNVNNNGSNPDVFDANGCPVSGTTNTPINTASCPLPPDTSMIVCSTILLNSYLNDTSYTMVDSAFDTVQFAVASGSYYGLFTSFPSCTDTIVYTITIFDCDQDNDGINDADDIDDDNDGIPDYIEACGDTATSFSCIGGDPAGDDDNDGVPNYQDTDFCTLNSANVCSSLDFDGDGVINQFDLDSDNDGITDVIEAGGFDPDNDGIIGVGAIVDTDEDGLADTVDVDNGGTPLDIFNTDGTGGPDFLDIDADDDGIVDIIEAQLTGSYVAPSGVDTDGDGIDDAYDVDCTPCGTVFGTPINPVNTDGTDNPDYRDLNSDNDAYPDTLEGWDTNDDGVADVVATGNDSDGDGLDDAFDTDGTSSTDNGGPDNTGSDPDDFPNDDGGSNERDWRENVAPTLGNEFQTVLEDDSTTSVNLLSNNIDADEDSLTIDTAFTLNGGSIVLINDSTVLYVPAPNFVGLDTVVYVVCDDANPAHCVTDSLFITVSPVNDHMTALSDSSAVSEDDSVEVFVLLNDNDTLDQSGLDTSSLDIVTSPTNGTVTVDTSTGTLIYTPDSNFYGVDSFQYVVCDTGVPLPATCDTAWVYVTVDPVNDQPIASNDSVQVTEDDSILIDVLLNDNDSLDLAGLDSTSVVIIGGPFNGTATVNASTGEITFIPDSNFFGLDSFQYVVCDTGVPLPSLCDTAWVIIIVLPSNDPPVAKDDSAFVNEDESVIIDVLLNDSDSLDFAGLDTSSVAIVTPPGNGTVTVDTATGNIIYTPDSNFFGLDSFQYVVCDTAGLCDTAWVFIDVAPINDAPIATNDSVSTDNGSSVVIDVQLNDFDIEGDLTTSIIAGGTNGTTTLLNGDSIIYVPDTGFCGTDTIIYQVCDTGLPVLCDTAFIYISVFPADYDIDSLPDWFETLTADSDKDGVPNYQDIDSDNDGIPDNVEAGSPDPCDPSATDTDGDGIPDYLDLDSDNDGIPDWTEGSGTIPTGMDSDGDGIDDAFDPDSGGSLTDNPLDSDGDGIPDWRDLDSDNDGISDIIESGGTDINGDGVIDDFNDENGDGADDNDIKDPIDTDGDGILDYLDLDSDNDGILDVIENGGLDDDGDGQLDNFTDSNGDGLNDSSTGIEVLDTDGDGIANYIDTDSDGDGINDGTAEGVDDTTTEDCDEDGIPNYLDPDPCITEIEIPEGFSPNGDDKNDLFVIKGVELYPENHLTIYNRWGNKVYEAEPYDNTWDGTNQFGVTYGGSSLPIGTYFYVFEPKDGSEPVTGYIYLNR